MDPAKAKPLILDLAKKYDGKDRFYLEAIGIAVGHHDKARRDVILADFDKEFPEWNDKVADLVWELQPPAMMPTLGKQLADKTLTRGAARPHRGHPGRVRRHGGRRRAARRCWKPTCRPEVRDKVIDNLKLFLPNKWAGLRDSKELAESIQTPAGQAGDARRPA